MHFRGFLPAVIFFLLFICGCGTSLRNPFYFKKAEGSACKSPQLNVETLFARLPEEQKMPAYTFTVDKLVEVLKEETGPRKQLAGGMLLYNGLALLTVMAGVVFLFWRSKWGVPLIAAGITAMVLINVFSQMAALIAWLTVGAGLAAVVYKAWDYHTERDEKIQQLQEKEQSK